MKNNYSAILYLLLLFSITLTSCVSYRYTNYGKPFDFLSSKKTEFRVKTPSLSEKDSLVTDKVEKETLITQKKEKLSVVFFVKDTSSSKEQNQLPNSFSKKERKPISIKNVSNATVKQQETVNSHLDYRPPEWWGRMWKALGKFFLKWLLIGLLIIAALLLVIAGIYYLALWIGGEIVAIIVLAILIIAIFIFLDIDLSWILKLL